MEKKRRLNQTKPNQIIKEYTRPKPGLNQAQTFANLEYSLKKIKEKVSW